MKLKLIGILLINFSFCCAQQNQDLVAKNLDFENTIAVSFYLKSIALSEDRVLIEIENSILENNYQQAEVLISQINSRSLDKCQTGRLLIWRALLYNKNSDYPSALEYLKLASKLLNSCSKADYQKATLNYWSTYILISQNKLSLAQATLNEALQYYSEDSLRFVVKNAKLYFWRGALKHKQGNYDSAIFWLNKSLAIFQNTPFDKTNDIIKVYNNLGNAYSEIWEYANAKASYEIAIQLNMDKVHNINELTIACANFGRFYDNYENFIKSKEWFEKCLQWLDNSTIPQVDKALIYQNYAVSLMNQYEFYAALNYYLLALKIIDPYRDVFVENYSIILGNLITLYVQLENESEAERYDELLSKFMSNKALELPDQYHLSRLNSVSFLKSKNQYDKSLILLYELEGYFLSKKNTLKLTDVYNQKGDVLLELNQISESRAYYKKSLDLSLTFFQPSHPRIIFILNDIGGTFLKENQFDSALFYFNLSKKRNLLVNSQITNELYSSKIEWLISNSRIVKCLVEKFKSEQGSLEEMIKAEGFLLSVVSLLQAKRIELNAEDAVNLSRISRDFFDVAMEYYFILYKETGNKEYIDKAFFISEKTKYQALHQSMKLDRVNAFAGVTNRVLQEENNLAKQMSQLEYQYSQELARQEEPLPELVEEYITGWKANSTRYDKLIDSIRNNLPNYYNLKFNKATVEINQIQSDLLLKDHNTAWVSYYFGAETCYAIIISDTEKHFINLGSSESIARLTKSFNNYVTHQAGEESLQTSNNLYKKLLHPVDSSINKSKRIKKIVIIPDDVLNYLNFELLTKPGQKDRHYALFDYQFSYGYSSTLLWAEFSEQLKWNASTLNMVGFAPEFIAQSKNTGEGSREGSENSNYDSFDFSPLSKNQEEVQQVSEILRHKKAKTSLYLGSKADESSFKKADLTNVNIIHLATHGFVSNNQKGVAGIAFAKNDGSTDDGILYMDEIFSLRNRANLVCLSACETGGGILNNGEGLLGLTRAFIYSGSQNLVVSLWKVQDESTAQLMTSFYSNLVKKQSISSSLRSAKLEMIKKNPSIHPYYWSAFIHIGLN